jgi:hypothetical protein
MYTNKEDSTMDRLKAAIELSKAHKTAVLYAAGILFVTVLALVLAYQLGIRHQSSTERDQQPQVVSQEQERDTKQLQNSLDISKKNAEELRHQIDKVQSGDKSAAAAYYVTAPTVERASAVVEQQIADDDPTIPAAAREHTDRTVVTPITRDQDGTQLPADRQKVDVYKVDLRRDHRIKAGATIIDGAAYGTIGYEQGRFEALVHTNGAKTGGSVMYNIAEW